MSYKFKLDVKDLPELTAEEKACPYADLYYREIAEPDAEVFAAFEPGKQMDPSKAIMPEDLVKMLEPGFAPEAGYCVTPEGIGYSCTVVRLPGVTEEIFDYRLKLVFSEDMGFKVEYPGYHMEHYDGLCIEDNCDGMKALILDRNYSMAELGFSGDPCKMNPKLLSISAHDQDIVDLEGPINTKRDRGVLILVNTAMEGGGLEQWWFVYTGMHIEDCKARVLLDEGEVVDPEICRRKGLHLAYEAVNQAQYLPILMERFPVRDFKPARPWPERYRFLQHH